jgi:hypothetical protein
VARALSAHPRIEVAVDPLLPLVRATRDALAAAAGIALPPGTPLLDGYASERDRAILDAVWEGDLDVRALAPPREALAARAAHEAPDLAHALADVTGTTARELWDAALGAIARVRAVPEECWVGTKEVWAADLIPAMSRAWADARFILVRRDPRAIAASNLAVSDAAQAGHPLSAARAWRKQEAIVARLRAMGLGDRIHVVGFEALVREPGPPLAAICAFLGVAEDRGLLDAGRARDADGRPFAANTSHRRVAPGPRPELAERWREALDPGALALVELACGPEMEAAGMSLTGAAAPEAALARLRDDDVRDWSWRTDARDPEEDLSRELARRSLIAGREPADAAEVRRSFLWSEALAVLRAGAP